MLVETYADYDSSEPKAPIHTQLLSTFISVHHFATYSVCASERKSEKLHNGLAARSGDLLFGRLFE